MLGRLPTRNCTLVSFQTSPGAYTGYCLIITGRLPRRYSSWNVNLFNSWLLNAEDKKTWTCSFSSPHAFKSWHLFRDTDNLYIEGLTEVKNLVVQNIKSFIAGALRGRSAGRMWTDMIALKARVTLQTTKTQPKDYSLCVEILS